MNVSQSTIPATFTFVKQLEAKTCTSDHSTQTCTICLDNIQCKESFVVLPCHHVFHHECAKKWFRVGHTCPTCKHVYPKQDVTPPPQIEQESVTTNNHFIYNILHRIQRQQERRFNESIFNMRASELKHILMERGVPEREIHARERRELVAMLFESQTQNPNQ